MTGANGSGKTTLLCCLAAMLHPTAGEVRWFGESPVSNPAARRLIGMVSHQGHLYPHLTLRENLVFAARMHGAQNPPRRADQLLDTIGLQHAAGRLPTQISRGMRQRLSVARALVHQPRIVLLDEPFTTLDSAATVWLCRLLGELRDRGRTVCFATHDEQKVHRLASRVLVLQSGRLTAADPARHSIPQENFQVPRAA